MRIGRNHLPFAFGPDFGHCASLFWARHFTLIVLLSTPDSIPSHLGGGGGWGCGGGGVEGLEKKLPLNEIPGSKTEVAYL